MVFTISTFIDTNLAKKEKKLAVPLNKLDSAAPAEITFYNSVNL